MSEQFAVEEQQESQVQSCRHHWIIETPNGATSRGFCKRCGSAKRFPNAAEDARWQPDAGKVGRWWTRKGVARPSEISLADDESAEKP
jgi:hypothetical protein